MTIGIAADPNKNWKVVPLSTGQLLDIRKEDILKGGLYRRCETYRGGGGYDQFPEICKRRLGWEAKTQFVVQLYGCNLDCPYCYVTREGVWGEFEKVSTRDLLQAFIKSDLDVFHLMGGAPALKLDRWPELIGVLDRDNSTRHRGNWVFHSDMMLTEGLYKHDALRYLACKQENVLIAVNIKGYNDQEWIKNTRKQPNWKLFEDNLENLIFCNVPFYITFTNVSKVNQVRFWADWYDRMPGNIRSFSIDLINYKALPHVDDTPWGGIVK